jgi:hypothetical protein
MDDVEYIDPEERRREKQASRDEDARRLAAGEVTPEQLNRENSFFAGLSLEPVWSDLPRALAAMRRRRQG